MATKGHARWHDAGVYRNQRQKEAQIAAILQPTPIKSSSFFRHLLAHREAVHGMPPLCLAALTFDHSPARSIAIERRRLMACDGQTMAKKINPLMRKLGVSDPVATAKTTRKTIHFSVGKMVRKERQVIMKRRRPSRPIVETMCEDMPNGGDIFEDISFSENKAHVVRGRRRASKQTATKMSGRSRRPAVVLSKLPALILTLFLATTALFIIPASANHAKLSIDPDFRGDFEQDLVVKIKNPTDVQFSPNGAELMMVPDKDGALYVVEDYEGTNPTVTKALEFKKICTNVERGLSGCAFHPDFGKNGNRYIYLYWTLDKYDDCDTSGSPTRGPVNRLARFVLGKDLKVDRDTEEVFFDTPIMPYGSHNSGQIRFGADGYLYVSVGDGGSGISTTNDDGVLYPQALDMLLGKILRLTADGGVPDDNPYMKEKSERCKSGWTSKASIKCQEIYSYGLRNPFRFAMDINRRRTSFYINDVGRHTWESIRPGGGAFKGANYGYPDREG